MLYNIFSLPTMKKLLLLSAILVAGATAADVTAQSTVTDLPAIHLTTFDGKPVSSKDEYVKARMQYVSSACAVTSYDSLRVRGRGGATWNLDKKPYKLKFYKKTRLLGTSGANAKKWNLLANHVDKTLMRNALASSIASFAGQKFVPGCEWVDLMINGTYAGTYQITDQIDIRKGRVNITEQPEVLTAATDITGGYLLEIDGGASAAADDSDGEAAVFFTTHGVKVTVKQPDEDVIVARQLDYIRAHVQKFEDALFADNWLDPEQGYRRYCDMTTLLSWYLTSELSGNPDSFDGTYFYKEKGDDRLYWGPVWDYEMAFNNDERHGDVSDHLIISGRHEAAKSSPWFDRLNQDPGFWAEASAAMQALVARGLEAQTLDFIDATARRITRSQELNSGLYPVNGKVHREPVLFNTYAEGVTYLKQWISARIGFLSRRLADRAAGIDPEASMPELVIPATDGQYLVSLIGTTLCFTGTDGGRPCGTWAVLSTSGATLLSGAIAPQVSLQSLAPGAVYLLHWTDGAGTPRSLKFTL